MCLNPGVRHRLFSSALLIRNYHLHSYVSFHVILEPSLQQPPRVGCAVGTKMVGSGQLPGPLPKKFCRCSMSLSLAMMTSCPLPTTIVPMPMLCSPVGVCKCLCSSPRMEDTALLSSSMASQNA